MEGEAQTGSLRDVIADQVDKLENTSEPATPATPAPAATPSAEPAAAPAAPAERPRDEQGRFLPQDKAPEKAAEPKPQPQAAIAPVAAQVPAKPHPSRPSSWKKDYWDYWEKLDPKLAEYINQREGEYAKGVSAYKTEYDRAKPLIDAVGQFAPEMQRMGVKPEQFVANLGNAHKTLALGTPEQKLSMFLKIAQDYGVPVQQLFQRGQDGQVYYNPQVQPYQAPAQPQQSTDVRSVVQDILMQEKAQQELAAFEQAAPEKYQHYEVVKETMAQLLDSGFSKTLESAYETALRLPQHSDLFEQAQQAKREADAKTAAEKARAEAERARRNTISPRSSTPAAKGGDGKPRSVRESIEAAAEQHLAGDRV